MIDKFKKVRLSDLKDFLFIVMSFIPGIIYKVVKKDKLIIVSERKNEAKDNGFAYFKYINNKQNQKKIKSYYAISTKSKDYLKVNLIGNTVNFGSFKHHILFWACDAHVSAHIGNGLPSHRVGFNFLKLGIYRCKNIFLQHGIVKHNLPFLWKKNNRLTFMTSTSPFERDFLISKFGYSFEEVRLTGLARYDGFKNSQSNRILIMPTWRIWLAHKVEDNFNNSVNKLLNDDYFKAYNSLLNDENLLSALEKYDLEIDFFLHSDMQIYNHLFKSKSDKVNILGIESNDVQTLLSRSRLLVTDYSSVSYDFAFLDKPIIFYKFDKDKYYSEQYLKSDWLGSDDSRFGKVEYKEEDVVRSIIGAIKNDFSNLEYSDFIDSFFQYRDNFNCKRIHEEILNEI